MSREGRVTAASIAKDLRAAIRSGTYKPGDRLPSEAALMSNYGVARMTARHGLSMLKDEGLTVTRHGSGVFVRAFEPIVRTGTTGQADEGTVTAEIDETGAGLVVRTLTRASLIALAQAVAVVALMHGALGVSWTLLPQTFAFAALLALAFTAVHAFLTAWLGRAGLLVSLVLVALQLAASGGLYPIEVLSGPFQAISPFLPLTWAVQGMQLIVSGAGGAAVATAAGVIALFGVLAAVGTTVVVGRRRGIRSIGFAATALG